MNSVVLGGGGFIGSHVAEALLALGHKVVVLDKRRTPPVEDLGRRGATILLSDLSDTDAVQEALHGAEVLFHFASTTVPKTSNDSPVYDVQTNLIGTLTLLKAAREAGIRKVVFPSSGGTVYGIPKEIPIAEDHPTNPISSYGIVKLTIEKYLHWFWTLHGLDYCILRVSNVYGEGQPATGLQGIIATLVDSALHGQEINIWGDGTVIRDYVHVSDVVDAFLKAARHEGELRVFNVGTGQGYSVNEIAEMVSKCCHQPLQIVRTPALASDVPVNILDNSRARQYLGWAPRVTLEDGILRTLRDAGARNDPQGSSRASDAPG